VENIFRRRSRRTIDMDSKLVTDRSDALRCDSLSMSTLSRILPKRPILRHLYQEHEQEQEDNHNHGLCARPVAIVSIPLDVISIDSY